MGCCESKQQHDDTSGAIAAPSLAAAVREHQQILRSNSHINVKHSHHNETTGTGTDANTISVQLSSSTHTTQDLLDICIQRKQRINQRIKQAKAEAEYYKMRIAQLQKKRDHERERAESAERKVKLRRKRQLLEATATLGSFSHHDDESSLQYLASSTKDINAEKDNLAEGNAIQNDTQPFTPAEEETSSMRLVMGEYESDCNFDEKNDYYGDNAIIIAQLNESQNESISYQNSPTCSSSVANESFYWIKESNESPRTPTSKRYQLMIKDDLGEECPLSPTTLCSSVYGDAANQVQVLIGSPLDTYASSERLRIRKPLAAPILFSEVTGDDLRRRAFKLYKRLNHDPWDRSHTYNDVEAYKFLQENSDTVAVQYDFEHFSGHLFPLSVLCALGASTRTIQQAYWAFPAVIEECDVWIGSPLHYACSHKPKLDVVSFLIKENPSMLKKVNQFGRTPLHMACLFKASTRVVSLLFEEYPQAADEKEKDGYTPLHLACENNPHLGIIRVLHSSLRCLAVTLKTESTPLHLACANNVSPDIVRELLGNGGTQALHMLDAKGYSPLHVAVKNQASAELVELLIQTEPNIVNQTTRRGYSTLCVAKHCNASAKVQQLLLS